MKKTQKKEKNYKNPKTLDLAQETEYCQIEKIPKKIEKLQNEEKKDFEEETVPVASDHLAGETDISKHQSAVNAPSDIIEFDGRDRHPIVSINTTEEYRADVERDRVSRVYNRIQDSAPDEIRLKGTVFHRTVTDSVDIDVVLDIGAGKSYMLMPHEYNLIPTDRLMGPREVVFADSRTLAIKEKVTVQLCLEAVDEETTACLETELFIIRCNPESSKVQVLVGRDLILAFGIDIFHATKAAIGNMVLFDADENETPTKIRDRVNWLQTVINHKNFVGMPRYLLEDIADADEEPISDTEARRLKDLLQKNSLLKEMYHSVKVTIGPPDDLAPWGRPTVHIPWVTDKRPPRNLRSVWSRDQLTCKRLTPEHLQLYREAVKSLVDGGYAMYDEGNIARHYIACRPVIKTDRASTKCRLCLDARIINRFTHQGEPITSTVVHSLLLFRSARFVGVYDLDKAFWQVAYSVCDTGWYGTIIDGRALVFRRMAFGANFSPSGLEKALSMVIKLGRERLKADPEYETGEPRRPTSNFKVNNYVDDFCNYSDANGETLLMECEWLRWFLNKHGFSSSKFVSNVVMPRNETQTTYLGYHWTLPIDMIRTSKKIEVCVISQPTVKDLVSKVAQFFDPLGLALKVQLAGRMLVREAFKQAKSNISDSSWTAPVNQDLMKSLKTWVEMANETTTTVDRYIDSSTLNIFCDASSTCWAYEVRDVEMTLIRARGGLTAEKASIPRNELVALFHAVNDLPECKETLNPGRIYIYVDSECTVHRINRSNRKLPSYEGRRIDKIRETLLNLDVEVDIVHIPGEHNAADFATRPWTVAQRPEVNKEILLRYQSNPNATRATHPFGGREESEESNEDECPPPEFVGLMTLRSAKRKIPPQTTEPESEQTTEPESDPARGMSTAPQVTEMETDQTLDETEDVEITHREKVRKILDSQSTYKTAEVLKNRDFSYDQWGLIRVGDKIVIPHQDQPLTQAIIQRIHERSRHPGISATTQLVQRHFTWRNLSREVKAYVNDCETCKTTRVHRQLRAVAGATFQLIDAEEIPTASIVGMDIVPIETADDEEYSAAIVVTDVVSKWIRAAPLKSQIGPDVVEALQQIFDATLYPLVIVSDNARCFKGRAMKRFAVQHGIRQAFLPAHASAYAGWIERSHGGLLSSLRVLSGVNPEKRWFELINESCQLTNTRPYSDDSQLCPLHLIYSGSHLADPEDLNFDSTSLLNKASMAHLLPESPTTAELTSYHQRQMFKRRRCLQKYEYFYNQRRRQIRERLRKGYRDSSNLFPIGCAVHVHRNHPRSKVGRTWSEVRRVVCMPSAGTRIASYTSDYPADTRTK
jgi:hypothetical protein